MKTLLMLMAYFDGKPVIPADVIRQEFFSNLTERSFEAKVSSGEIKLPLMRMDGSKRGAKGVHIADLATFLDEARAAAVKELEQISSEAWWTGHGYSYGARRNGP